MKKYYGNHLAIVIQNNDPDRAGRVKVWVPEVQATILEKWEKTKVDKKFKFMGLNIDSDLTPVLEDLKAILPWAECASPISNESASGRYNNYLNKASISDTSKNNSFVPSITAETTSNIQNDEGIGEKPGNIFESNTHRLNDAFDSATNNVNRPNPFSFNYTPQGYSNGPKGEFGIPSVGAHVWVFFRDGNPHAPVYFAAKHSQADWAHIYEAEDSDGIDYPGTFENKSKGVAGDYNDNVDRYRSKYVINQKGGTIQIVNTDGKEQVKLSHASGSFKELNNLANVELAINQDQKLVKGDQYLTVRGYGNVFFGSGLDELVQGDKYKKVGKLNEEAHQQWKDIAAGIADVKQRFDLQRAAALSDPYIKKTSTGQSKSGSPAPNPNFNQEHETLENEFGSVSKSIVNNVINEVSLYSNVDGDENDAEVQSFPSGGGNSPSSMDGNWNVDSDKDNLAELIKSKVEELAEIEQNLGLGGSEIIDIAKHKIETIGLVMNDFGSIRIDEVGKMYNAEVQVDDRGVYERKKESPLVEYVHVDDLPGGSYTLNVCNRFNVQVGAGGINLNSYGPANLAGTITNVAGEQVNIASENEVNIDGGKRLTISADILTLRQRNQRQVLVDSSLGVSKNLIIGGGLHVEGELSCQHITAPMEIQETEQVELYGQLVGGLQIGTVVITGGSSSGTWPVLAVSTPNTVKNYPHSHNFANAAMTLLKSNKLVRGVGKLLNQGIARVAAKGPKHEKKS